MNFLFLLDLAPDCHPLLVGTGKALNKQGHKTFYALDSPQNERRFPEDSSEGESRIFSRFLGEFPKDGQQTDYPWKAFFPE